MPRYAIEIYWPGMTLALVEELVRRAASAAAETDGGLVIIDCSMAPRDETCSLRVLAVDDPAVQAFMTQLGLDGARATEQVEVASEAADEAPAAS